MFLDIFLGKDSALMEPRKKLMRLLDWLGGV